MGWFDGFPFKSRAQMRQEQEAFEKRVFPFGEAQKGAALAVLQQITSQKLQDSEKLFAFITAKDRYVLDGKSDEALGTARAQLRKMRWVKPEDVGPILSLVKLDAEVEELDRYPGAELVMAAVAFEDQ